MVVVDTRVTAMRYGASNWAGGTNIALNGATGAGISHSRSGTSH